MPTRRLEFRILGPLTVRVDGGAVPIGGPKQRALLALLLLSANRVVPREQLIEELFAEQRIGSADHALRNHVSRLRKVLAAAADDEPRIVARAPGYLLRVEPGELDLDEYQRLVTAGSEALAAGDASAAAESLRSAERLWHGRPFADLEFEPFARLEVERLEELRLAAVEQRIDAELELGRQLTLVPELETLAAEHPLRERFRAQLMLALYRCGRQADGLEVYRRTRTMLQEELGLEPSLELQDLERAILVQDVGLAERTDGHIDEERPQNVCPFKGLAPFEPDDAEFFFGRERLVDELVGRLQEAPLLALVGASGSGKSSLLRAGLLPALGREYVLVRPGTALPHFSGLRITLAIDQFEELFAPAVSEAERRAFVNALVDAVWDPERRAIVLLALRADFFGRLAPYVALADLVGPNHALLAPMSPAELRRAIEGPAQRAGLTAEPALVDALVDDVGGEPGGLPLLSTALLDLWHQRDGQTLTLAAYRQTGGVRGSVARHAESAYRALGETERPVARRILLRLVSADGDGDALTRRRATAAELDVAQDPTTAHVLAALVERRLLVADDGTVELVHEALLERWPRLRAWLDEDRQGRRVHRHLTDTATEWQAAGRDQGELYRGARLAAALEWADAAGGDAGLNRLEREFLEASRASHARANRRLRGFLAVALVLLVAALVAGAVALEARGSAKREATAAIAQRLGAQALIEPRLDRALLLAREGVNLDDSSATRGNMLAALLRAPAAVAVLRGHDPRVLDEALSPDGRLLAIRGNNSNVSFFNTRTMRELGTFKTGGQLTYCGAIVRPVRALAFSPDGRTLAVGDFGGIHATLFLIDARTHRERASKTSTIGATDDVAYTPGGRTLVTGQTVTCGASPPPERLAVRRARDGSILRKSSIIAGGRFIGFTPDGRFVLATSGETTSYLLDARTLRRRRTFPLSGSGALSPVAYAAAFGQDDGSVKLVDLRTGAVRPMDRRATGKVIGIGFSRDGNVLATTSDDGSVDVWDAPTARLRETFTGHSGAAVDPVFSSDGQTLYTASDDGSVIAWDVGGERRLGRPFRFDPRAHGGQGPHPPTQNASGTVAVSPDSSLFATSPGPNRLTLWRAQNLVTIGELRGPCGGVRSIAFSHDGRLVAATGDGKDTVVWNVGTRKIVRLLGPSKGGSSGVNFSRDDRTVGTASEGAVWLYDLRSGRATAKLNAKGTEQDLDFSPDGERVAAAGLAGTISIWNLRSRTLERTIPHGDLIVAIRFSPDGMQIATGDLKGNTDLWDASTGRRVGVLAGQNGFVLSVTYSPDGKEVMTTSGDGKFRLWDLASGKLVGAPLPAADTGGGGTFFPNGRQVIAAFWSGIGVVWNVDPKTWRAQACRVAKRGLTRAEWRSFLPERPVGRVC